MKYFTSDWHLGEDRLGIDGKPNLFYRPFSSIEEQNQRILAEFINSGFTDGDELYHLGDVVYSDNENSWEILKTLKIRYPNSTFNLIIGNYDEDKIDKLGQYFDTINESLLIKLETDTVYLNHYPKNCKNVLNLTFEEQLREIADFAITGHIHGLWKVQENMINVGVDAWHFRPVSAKEILFCWNAMKYHYDGNVFPHLINKI